MKHQVVIKGKKDTERSKSMDKYAKLKRLHHDLRLQVYIYNFIYVDTDTIPVDENFTTKKTYVLNYKKMSTPGTVPKNWLGFSYIVS